MVNQNGDFPSWTLAEAKEVCVLPQVHAEHAAAVREWREAGAPRAFIYGRASLARSVIERKRWAEAQPRISLWQMLTEGRLAATGRPGSPLADPQPIPATAWPHLKLINSETSLVEERSARADRIFNVRIYPVIEAPHAVDLLDGRSLAETCHEFVVNDPEVAATHARRVVAAAEPPAVLQHDSGPGLWPLDGDWNGIAVADAWPGMTDASGDLAKQEYDIVARRLARLIQLLADGLLAAETPEHPLPRIAWRRRRIFLYLRTGGLVGIAPRSTKAAAADSKLLIEGLVLRKPVPGWEDVESRRGSAQAAPPTTARARTECRDWLVDRMKASPDHRPRPKSAWKEDALEMWAGRLSARQFELVWAEAIQRAGADAWSKPGAPRKSNRRTD